jgi:menaquinone-dependent protoporphyrinogen IX oxidase
MSVVDMLVDAAAGHKVISFIDGNARYNRYSWQKKIFIRLLLDALVF